jgi:chromosomal replication initiator protein
VPQAQIRISDIQDVVSRRFGLTVADLQGRSRRGRINDARQIAMYLARRLTRKTFIAIARQFGGRGHAGVFKAWQNIDRLRGHDTELDGELQALAARLHERARTTVSNQ